MTSPWVDVQSTSPPHRSTVSVAEVQLVTIRDFEHKFARSKQSLANLPGLLGSAAQSSSATPHFSSSWLPGAANMWVFEAAGDVFLVIAL